MAKRLGITVASYAYRWRAPHPSRFKGVPDLMRHAHSLDAGGIQAGLDDWNARDRKTIRQFINDGMFLEGQIALPRTRADLPAFESRIRSGRDLGVTIVRTVMLSGRRYETFDTEASFREFAKRSWTSLTLAEPIVRKHKVRLALENHKDWRIPEMLDIMKRISSEWVGICVDTGNSISLLEDPMAVVREMAPWAMTVHFKDMAVQSHANGFLLSEVPFGNGFLDLKEITRVLESANPDIQFNLEMITRDPLKVPCLTDTYWATMPSVKAQPLAETLARVRQHEAPQLPRVAGRSPDDRIAFEEANVRQCFAHAARELGMTNDN